MSLRNLYGKKAKLLDFSTVIVANDVKVELCSQLN